MFLCWSKNKDILHRFMDSIKGINNIYLWTSAALWKFLPRQNMYWIEPNRFVVENMKQETVPLVKNNSVWNQWAWLIDWCPPLGQDMSLHVKTMHFFYTCQYFPLFKCDLNDFTVSYLIHFISIYLVPKVYEAFFPTQWMWGKVAKKHDFGLLVNFTIASYMYQNEEHPASTLMTSLQK